MLGFERFQADAVPFECYRLERNHDLPSAE
jgi:hypothetical protein